MMLPTQDQILRLYEENARSHEHCDPDACADSKHVRQLFPILVQTREYRAILETFAADPATSKAEAYRDVLYVMARSFYMGLQMGLRLCELPSREKVM